LRESREVWRLVGRWVLAAPFVGSGVLHLLRPEVFMKIMPPYLPAHRELVLLSGVIEVGLGVLLLVRATRRGAAWGLIALLIAVFPANVFMYQHPEVSNVPTAALLIRLPVQGLLILWAYAYTRR
jgi:uncharacterized membrane protein